MTESGSNEIKGCVGVKSDGWNGVGVAVALGADVMRMNGMGGCSEVEAEAVTPHAEIK